MTKSDGRANQLTWIFNLESTASLLIALGGLLSALAAKGVVPAGPALSFAEQCFFPLQLPVFYFGYGYLYQRQWTVDGPRGWAVSMGRELVYMLVPLAAVTVPTLLIDGWAHTGPGFGPAELVHALFVDPVIPVGFFLVALALYALVPTFATKRRATVFVAVACALKVLAVALSSTQAGGALMARLPYVASGVMANGIWFTGGMALAFAQKEKGATAKLGSPAALWVAWVAAALALFWAVGAGLVAKAVSQALLVALGLWASAALYSTRFATGREQWRLFAFIDGYTKGIWLMHPMLLTVWFHLAAGWGLDLWAVAVASFAVAYGLPVAINMAFDKAAPLGFLINPSHYLTIPPSAAPEKD